MTFNHIQLSNMAERIIAHYILDGVEYLHLVDGKLEAIKLPNSVITDIKESLFSSVKDPNYGKMIFFIHMPEVKRLIMASIERGHVYHFQTKPKLEKVS